MLVSEHCFRRRVPSRNEKNFRAERALLFAIVSLAIGKRYPRVDAAIDRFRQMVKKCCQDDSMGR
jgi:hypothetical protein